MSISKMQKRKSVELVTSFLVFAVASNKITLATLVTLVTLLVPLVTL